MEKWIRARYLPGIPLGKDGRRVTAGKEHIALSRRAAREGMVTTDWWTFGEHYKEVTAGNDMKMATGFPDRLLEAVEKGVLTRGEMETAAENILRLILRID